MTKYLVMILLALMPGLVMGQATSSEALVKSKENLAAARTEYQSLQQEIAEKETPLVLEVEALEEELKLKERGFKEVLAKENQLGADEKKLLNELSNRRGEFDYTRENLDSYSKGFLTRVHAAEQQIYKEEVEALRRNAASEKDLAKEIELRMEALLIGAKRLQGVAGGKRFEGRGLLGSDFVNGDFALVGPVGYFSAKGKNVAGYTGLNQDGFPAISDVDGEASLLIKTLIEKGKSVVPIDATGGKALQAKELTPTLKDRIRAGGKVGWAIIILGGIAMLAAIFKFYHISSFPIPNIKTINAILDDLIERRPEEAMQKAKKVPGLCGQMVEAGVENFYEKRRILEDALLEKLSGVQPKLESMLPFLSLTAAAAPMMGLLGTVLGIMKTFDAMAIYGTGNAQNFSKGIGEALVTTAQGLIVAIPLIVIHGMLKSLARGRLDKAQGVALALLNGTTELVDEAPDKSKLEDDGGEEQDFDETDLVPA